jgi:hypothetical protein
MSYRTSKCNRVSKNSVEAGGFAVQFLLWTAGFGKLLRAYLAVFLESAQSVCFMAVASVFIFGSAEWFVLLGLGRVSA